MTTYAWFVRGEQHAALAEVAMSAVRKVDRAAHCIVATDDASLPDGLGNRMIRFEPGLPLMVANLEAQLAVLWEMHTPVWFLDTDILLLKPLPEMWDEELCVTWRDTVGGKLTDPDKQAVAETMPYNFGVLGAHPGRRVFEAFLWMRERVRVMAPALRDWYGNQLALASLAGPRPQEGTTTEDRSIPWQMTRPWPSIRVRKLPCEVWNYTPAEPDEDISGRGALHFKGHSRPLMAEYAERLKLPLPKEAA